MDHRADALKPKRAATVRERYRSLTVAAPFSLPTHQRIFEMSIVNDLFEELTSHFSSSFFVLGVGGDLDFSSIL